MNNVKPMKLVFEAFEEATRHIWLGDEKGVAANVKCHQAIESLRQAIEQTEQAEPKQDWSMLEAMQGSLREHMARIKELESQLAQQAEPVAWINGWGDLFKNPDEAERGQTMRPLYASPPVVTNDTSQERVDETAKQRHWVGLTDWEINSIAQNNHPLDGIRTFARAIEAKLKEKNNA